MRDVPVTEVAYLGMRNIAINNATGAVVTVLTDREHADLVKRNGRPPARIAKEWDAGKLTVAGGCPHFEGHDKGFLPEGAVADMGGKLAIGHMRPVPNGTKRISVLYVDKAKVTIGRARGLALTKQTADAWDENATGIVAIADGVMTVRE